MSGQRPADPTAAGVQVVDAAAEQSVELRLLGGIAIDLRCPDRDPSLRRESVDIDVVVDEREGGAAARAIESLGYAPRTNFNALNGSERMIFDDVVHQRHVDVFVGDFKMSHRIPLEGRLGVDARTIPLAELLLTKLQVYEVNRKDLLDAAALLSEHALGDETDGDAIGIARLQQLLGADWGLCTTSGRTLDSLDAFAAELPAGVGERVRARAGELRELVEQAPKTRAWRMRARVGTRVRWYDLPEEP